MAGPRSNLAVTKDGEMYNKLQRPDDFLHKTAATNQANERKRERAVGDGVVAGPGSSNKRTKTHHTDSRDKELQPSEDRRQHRSAGTVSECGMRTTLPIDEEEHSDDFTEEALAYLRSVRSEASTIPHLLVASEFHGKNAPNVSLEDTTASTGQHAIYQDGTWIAVDEGYEAAQNDNHGYDDSGSEELYYRLLVKRFKGLRTTLKQPGLHKLAQKSIDGADQLPSVKPPLNRHEWLYILDREYPRPAQISQLDEKNIKRGLEYCVHAMDRFNTISSQKSCWIWTLLALSSDIGTLDSRKMSHIRDLGNKAGQLSIDLHQGTESRNFASDNDLVYARQGLDGSQDDIDANEPALYDANGDKKNLGTESFQPGTNEYKDTTIEDTVSENVSDAQDGMQLQAIVPAVSECPVGNEESTDINTNRSALERARARLLAQLGDNLVQAGIPTAAHNIESTPLGRSEQLDQGLNDSGHEPRVRAIPSRAEAERQRQMMRIRSSTTEIPSKVDSPYSESSSAVPTVTENQVLCAVDLNTRVTIDMILTVVAECYGQRDLLRYRRPW